jgi:hypothetical protein
MPLTSVALKGGGGGAQALSAKAVSAKAASGPA